MDRKESKKILIVSFSPDDWDGYRRVLKSLFSEESIELFFTALSAPNFSNAEIDLILVTYRELKNYAALQFSENIPIIVMNHTLEKVQVNIIKNICKQNRISIVSDSLYYSESRKNMMIAMGIPTQCINVWSPELSEDLLEDYIILFEGTELKQSAHRTIYRFGEGGRGLIAMDSIIQIFMILERMDLLDKNTTKRYFDRIDLVTNYSIKEISMADYYTYIHEPENRRSCLYFSNENEIYYCDSNGQFLLGKKAKDIIGKSIFQIFPQLKEYRNKLNRMGEKIIAYGDRTLIIYVWQNITHGYYNGYIDISDYAAVTQKEHRLRKQILQKNHNAKYQFSMISGKSEAIMNCIRIAHRIACSDAGVLITGPSGCGKELFAQSIHNASSRKKYPFVSVNCGALMDSLLESELFGYESGAFTGAKKEGHMGMFELAHNGTLFLDEVGDMPMNLQIKLLRVLQEREVMRIGGNNVIPIDVRIIAATNRNLRQLMHEGKFRLDLYYRINILPLEIPSLNDRREDIMEIFHNIQKKNNFSFQLDSNVIDAIINHNYEGNIRELQNILEYIGSIRKFEIHIEDLPAYVLERYTETSYIGHTDIKIMIIKAIENINKTGSGAGRRSIRSFLANQGIFYSEGRIRTCILQLEENGIVEIQSGRGGTWSKKILR